MKTGLFSVISALMIISAANADEHDFERFANIGITAGYYNFEGDESVKDAPYVSLHAGWAWKERWSLEGVLSVADLDENFANSYGRRISRLERRAGVDETSFIGLAFDALFHVAGRERFDPYISLGTGITWYEDDVDGEIDPALRLGGGFMFHLSECLGLRADVKLIAAGDDSEMNSTLSGGLVWAFASSRVSPMRAEIAPDSDGDGITDVMEERQGSNPFEVDSDFDGLSDADEINIYKTDPLKRDTDGGSVADGHEVIEDGTNPLESGDDLMVFELNVQFENKGVQIRPEYLSDLDAIAAILRKTPKATARIEGHTDAQKGASAKDMRKLTNHQTESIAAYFKDRWKIDSGRMITVGYGFDRPRAPNDPITGNPQNRRIEIYIRNAQ